MSAQRNPYPRHAFTACSALISLALSASFPISAISTLSAITAASVLSAAAIASAAPAGTRTTSHAKAAKTQAPTGQPTAAAGPDAEPPPKPHAKARKPRTYPFPREAHLGYVLADAEAPDGKILECHECEQNFTPASTQKLYTTWIALETLGGDRTFATELQRTGAIRDGALRGDLVIKGGGDPSFAGNQFGSDRNATAVFGRWIDTLKAAGVRRIEGCVVGDGSWLEEDGPHPAELWEDAGNYYAGIAAGLCFNDNLFTAEFTGAASEGKPVYLRRTAPAHAGIAGFDNRLTTGPANSRDSAYFLGGFPSPVRLLRGTYPARRSPFYIKGSLPNPAWTCAREFHDFLAARGIEVAGEGPACGDSLRLPNHAPVKGAEPIPGTRIESPPLRELIRIVNQKSDNNWAAQLLAILGRETGRAPTWQGGLAAADHWLQSHGFDRRLVHLKDGNGLSRYNWVAPAQTARLLLHARKSPRFEEFKASLVGAPGSEGKLDRYGKGWEGRLYVKTGTLEGVNALAGYLRGDSGKWLAFAIAANNFEAYNGDGQKYFIPILRGWAKSY